MMRSAPHARIGIFHPADPAGHIPSGIDTVIRGIVRHAPPDLEYTVFGATSDPEARPIDRSPPNDAAHASFVPLVTAEPTGRRQFVPLAVRYLAALRNARARSDLRDLDVLDFHRAEPLALFAADPRPKNLMLHHDMAVLRNPHADIGWRRAPWLYELGERRWLPLAERVFCVRRSAVARYKVRFPKLAGRFEFLPTWADTGVFRPLAPDARGVERERRAGAGGPAANAYWVIWVGRLDRQKNPLLVIDALQRVTSRSADAHLVMIGDGGLRPQVEAHIARLGLERRVTLCGALPPQGIAAWLASADLFVLSSAYEGMPIVVLEALACGVPVVTTDVGEVRLVVRDGVDGFVVAEHTAAALAAGIEAARRAGPTLRGAPCVAAVAPYAPERVLGRIYENHREQAAARRPARAAV